jgi:prolyl-tRNA editing enzyme YbaK/EbsC (Cys-tRNA(Pro) deacylase)
LACHSDEVRAATGQTIGGVAPVGHPSPLRTWIDRDLAGYAQLCASAGTIHAVFATTFQLLTELTGATRLRVTNESANGVI